VPNPYPVGGHEREPRRVIGSAFTDPDDIRARFSRALSRMYRAEVPQHGALITLVSAINAAVLASRDDLRQAMEDPGELARLAEERHGAIRVGAAAELAISGRALAVMGMTPVGYYDLAPAGVPVHSTAFWPVETASLQGNSFRVFTSLLRLKLIEDADLRQEAAETLARQDIFTPEAKRLIQVAEPRGGLTDAEADAFVAAVLGTFRWHSEATVGASTNRHLVKAHRLVADVFSFRGPHINHLPPARSTSIWHRRRCPGSACRPRKRSKVPTILRHRGREPD